MTTEVLIQGELRESFGSSTARAIRNKNMVPAVVYGKNKEQLHVCLPAKEVNALANTFEFKTKAVTLEINKKKYTVLPREVNLHPVTDSVEHVDFMYLSGKEKLRVDVPLYYSNKDKSVGIKRGGALNAVFRDIKVEAQADAIPEYLEIDLSKTVVGDVIRFSDISFPEGVRPIEKNMQVTVAKIVGKRSLEVQQAEEESEEGASEESAAEK